MATETDKIINPFKEQDIEYAELPSSDVRYGSDVLNNIKEMKVGDGRYAFYSDESGIWLGSKKFSTAPFSVSMAGVLKANSGTFSGDIDGANITGSTITGSTLSTGGSGDQHIEIESTIISYYDENGDDVGYTYAEDGTYIVKSSGDLHFIGASSGDLSISFGSSIDYVMNNNYFYPVNDADLGTSAHRWGKIYSDNINCGNILSGDVEIPYGSLTLGNQTLYTWSDIESYISVAPTPSQIEDILDNDLGGVTNLTLRVRRVDSGGVDSGWYQLSVDYGLVVGYSVN